MCGIAGIYNYNCTSSVEESSLGKMNEVQRHRGPDNEGIWVSKDKSIGFAHRRLAVIDLSSKTHQPMVSDNGRYILVSDGEIYNYLEIRKELQKLGWQFRTESDTEVLLNSFQQWGEKAIHKFNGIFAFSIWNEQDKILWIYRDHLGAKPLYYYQQNGQLIWTSEIGAIESVCSGLKVDEQAVDLYFTLSYIPAPRTYYQNVNKLEPGHFLKVSKGKVEKITYWQPSFKKRKISYPEAKEHTLELLKDAVKLRLRSDVPLGAFLSGGVDSSAVVAMMAECGVKVRTFSISFKEKGYDESKYARFVAKQFGTEHHEFRVTKEHLESLPEIARYFGEPFGDSSALPFFYLCKFARKYITVALSGDGGDELFCGYSKYPGYKISQTYQSTPLLLRKPWERLVDFGSTLPFMSVRDRINWLRKVTADSYLPPLKRDIAKRSICRLEERKKLLKKKNLTAEKWLEERLSPPGIKDEIDRLTYGDISLGLPDDMFVKADRMSMAHSLVTRTPLLDLRMVEFALSLPNEIRIPGWISKHLLKDALGKYFPKSFLYRKKKGFRAPIRYWLRDSSELMSKRGPNPQLEYLKLIAKEKR